MADAKPHKTGCLVCGKKTLKARGLCDAHFQRFRLKLRSMATAVEKEAYEAELERLGWLLPPKSPGRQPVGDIFDQIAEKVVEEKAGYRAPPEPKKRRSR